MAANRKKLFAVAELMLAAAFWGFGFIAAVWSLRALSPGEVTWMRFVLASLVGLPFFLVASGRAAVREVARLSFLPAVLLAATLIFQTWGLKYTTATKSGFITTLYVVFVPIIDALRARTPLPKALWLCVAMAFVGTGLIVNLSQLEHLNVGDVLTLICAFAATGQIYWLSVVSPRVRQPFVFNIVQAFWCVLLLAPFAVQDGLGEKLATVGQWGFEPVIGLLTLAFGSTVLAFYLQVRAQAHLSATVSSLLFLLESPFALIFAVWLLGEHLGPWEACGAALIFLSAVGASILESQRKK